jgi:hypothetical protein
VALWLRQLFRCEVAENTSARKPVLGTGGDNHFAQTDNDAVVVEICGYGPTDTRYFEARNDPRASGRK